MKRGKKLIYGILILLAIIIAISILLGRYTDRVIDPYVRSLLEVQKPMNHHVEYKKIRVNLFERRIKITDVNIYPDSSLVKEEKIWYEIKISTIELTDFSIMEMLLHQSLIIVDLVCDNPEVYMHLPVKPVEEIIVEVEKEKKPEAKDPKLKNISLERIILSNGIFQLIRNDMILASSPDINLLVREIRLVKNNREDPIGYSFGDVSINLTDININAETGLYDISLGSFSANNKDSTIVLKEFRMIPKYDKKEFSKYQDFQGDRMDVKVGRIDFERVGLKSLELGKSLEISCVRIDSIDADIYRDKNLPVDLNRFPLFYNEAFVKVSLPLLIDTLMITNSKILYNELAEGNAVTGEIILSDFNLNSYGLSNRKIDSTKVNEMRLFVNAKVMGEGSMNVELALPLEGNLREFRCTGSVGSMQLSPLNDMLGPSINMIFKGGKVNRMTFDFSANNNVSKGWMEFLYQDLDVVLRKKEPGKEWGFISSLANAMAVSNNPPPGKDLKVVEIGFERDKNKGIIGYIWKTIQSGMVRTILPVNKYEIKRNKEQKVQNQEMGKGNKEKKKKKK